MEAPRTSFCWTWFHLSRPSGSFRLFVWSVSVLQPRGNFRGKGSLRQRSDTQRPVCPLFPQSPTPRPLCQIRPCPDGRSTAIPLKTRGHQVQSFQCLDPARTEGTRTWQGRHWSKTLPPKKCLKHENRGLSQSFVVPVMRFFVVTRTSRVLKNDITYG